VSNPGAGRNWRIWPRKGRLQRRPRQRRLERWTWRTWRSSQSLQEGDVNISHHIHCSNFISFFSLKIKELVIYLVNVVELIEILFMCCSYLQNFISKFKSFAEKNIFSKGTKSNAKSLSLLKGKSKYKENQNSLFPGSLNTTCNGKPFKENTLINILSNVYFFRKRGHFSVTHVEAGLVWQVMASVLYEGGREQAPPRVKTTFLSLRYIVIQCNSVIL
jgi:hypothetical protein